MSDVAYEHTAPKYEAKVTALEADMRAAEADAAELEEFREIRRADANRHAVMADSQPGREDASSNPSPW